MERPERAPDLLVDETMRPLQFGHAARHGERDPEMGGAPRDRLTETDASGRHSGDRSLLGRRHRGLMRIDVECQVEDAFYRRLDARLVLEPNGHVLSYSRHSSRTGRTSAGMSPARQGRSSTVKPPR